MPTPAIRTMTGGTAVHPSQVTEEQGFPPDDQAPVGLDTRLRRLAAEDADGDWNDFLASEAGFLRAVARDHLDGEDLVDDTVQEAAMRCRQALPRYRSYSDSEARGWLRGIVRHAAKDLIAAERARRRRERTVCDKAEQTKPSPAHVDAATETRMRSALAELPGNQHRIIDLHYFTGLTFVDIAKRLELTPNHVHVLHRRALLRLRRRLARSGGTTIPVTVLLAALAHPGKAVAAETSIPLSSSSSIGPAATEAPRTTVATATKVWTCAKTGVIGAGSLCAAALVLIATIAWYPADDAQVIRQIQLGHGMRAPFGKNMAACGDTLWFSNGSRLLAVDAQTGTRRDQTRLSINLEGEDARYSRTHRKSYVTKFLTADNDLLWLQGQVSPLPNRLLLVDPQTGTVLRRITEIHTHIGLAAGGDRLWSITADGHTASLLALDAHDGRILDRVPLPESIGTPSQFTHIDDSIWLVDHEANQDDMLVRINPSTGHINERRRSPTDRVLSLCSGGPGRLWVTAHDNQAWLLDITAASQ